MGFTFVAQGYPIGLYDETADLAMLEFVFGSYFSLFTGVECIFGSFLYLVGDGFNVNDQCDVGCE